jgi:threonine aldolase
MQIVDLRSDTVTLPTSEMRRAMYEAEVGDDVYGEDPTIRQLEQLGAQIAGKEAALFVASGTMGNQIATMIHAQRGDEIICESESHIYYYEVGGLAYLAGVQARPLIGVKGILTPESIRQAIRGIDIHQPKTALICLENTHNRAGGVCYSSHDMASIKELADCYNIPVHIDGARIFNAAVAQNVMVDELTQYAHSVTFCLSKGLCAPVGSLLTGSQEFIEKARRYRKMLGGGMRQAGILAAAGIVALKTMVDRLAEDHLHARILGAAIANLGLTIDLSTIQTNIVLFDVAGLPMTTEDMVTKLNQYGVKVSQFGDNKLRMVTHHGITKADIEYTLDVLARIIKG